MQSKSNGRDWRTEQNEGQVPVNKKHFKSKIKIRIKRQRKPYGWNKHKVELCRQRGEICIKYKGQLKDAKTNVTGNYALRIITDNVLDHL